MGLDLNIITNQTVEQLAPITSNAGASNSLIDKRCSGTPPAP